MMVGISTMITKVDKKVKIGNRRIKKQISLVVLSMVCTQKKLIYKHFSQVKYIENCDSLISNQVTQAIQEFLNNGSKNF